MNARPRLAEITAENPIEFGLAEVCYRCGLCCRSCAFRIMCRHWFGRLHTELCSPRVAVVHTWFACARSCMPVYCGHVRVVTLSGLYRLFQ